MRSSIAVQLSLMLRSAYRVAGQMNVAKREVNRSTELLCDE